MSVENLTLFRVPLHKSIPPDAEKTLCFEPTINGIISARDWLKKHTLLKKLYRILIPYSKSFANPVLNPNEEVYPKYKVVDVALPVVELESTEALQAMLDVLHNQIIMRQVKSGLSKLQEHMLALHAKELSHEEILGATSMLYKVPMQTIRKEFHKLTIGNFPRLQHLVLDCLPHAVINGPLLLNPKEVAKAIEHFINTGECSLLDSEEWDPHFLEGSFTIHEYIRRWLDATLDLYVTKLAAMCEEEHKQNRKRQLVRTLCTSQFDMMSEKVLFLGETISEKRRRIKHEYNGDYTLLETTIAECNMDFVLEHDKAVPESARDLLIAEMLGNHF